MDFFKNKGWLYMNRSRGSSRRGVNLSSPYSLVKTFSDAVIRAEREAASIENAKKQEKNNHKQNENTKEKTPHLNNGSNLPDNFEFDTSDESILLRWKGTKKQRSIELPTVSPSGVKVTSVAEGAFADFSDLAKIVIPEGIVSIGKGAFFNCSSLGSVILPSTLKSIGDEAFKGCVSLKSITLGAALEQLGKSAFSECTLLKKATFASGSVLKEIPPLCFFECESLREIKWPEALQEIKEEAFRACTEIETLNLPTSLARIGYSAFRGCTRLKSIDIPSELKSVAEFAFAECSSLESVELPESIIALEGGIFSNCSKLRSVKLSASLQEIGCGSFSGCSSLEDFAFPASLSTVGVRAFCDCVSLKKIDLSRCKLSVLEQEVFSGCSGLHEVYLPFCLREIYKACFKGCSDLYAVEIPGEVVSLGERCFEDCRKLNEIDLSSVPVAIPEGFCSDCAQLTSIRFHNDTPEIGVCAFANCRSLTKLELPEKLQVIRERAFLNCSGLLEVNCGQELRRLGSEAFKGCNALRRVDLPASLTVFGKEGAIFSSEADELVIYGTPSSSAENYARLHRIKFYDPLLHEIKEDGAEEDDELEGTDTSEDTSDEDLTPEEEETEVVIPGNKTIRRQVFGLRVNPSSYKAITSKGDWIVIRHKAFEKKADARSNVPVAVHLEGINHIGNRAFCNRNVVFLDCSDNLVSIGKAAFWGCNLLQKVRWSNRLSFIDKSAFWGCNSLKNLDFPDSLQFIDNWAFLGCSGIESIHLPSYLVSLGDYVFAYCSSLVNIVIPSGTRSLGVGVFFGCQSLRRVVIPPSVKQFGPEMCKFSPIFGSGCALEGASETDEKAKDTEQIIIVCQKDSAAHEYAMQFGIKYELINFEDGCVANELITKGGDYMLCGLGVSDSLSRCTQAFSVKAGHSIPRPVVRLIKSEADKVTASERSILNPDNCAGLSQAKVFSILQGAYELVDLASYIKAWHRVTSSSAKRILNSSRMFSSIEDMSPIKDILVKDTTNVNNDEQPKEIKPEDIMKAACDILDRMEKIGWFHQFGIGKSKQVCRLHKKAVEKTLTSNEQELSVPKVAEKLPSAETAAIAEQFAATTSAETAAVAKPAAAATSAENVTAKKQANIAVTSLTTKPTESLLSLSEKQPTHILSQLSASNRSSSMEAPSKLSAVAAVGALNNSSPLVTTKLNLELERYYKGALALSGIRASHDEEKDSPSNSTEKKEAPATRPQEGNGIKTQHTTLSTPVAELLNSKKSEMLKRVSASSDSPEHASEGIVLAKVPNLSVSKVDVPNELKGRFVEALSDNFMKGNDVVEEINLGPSLKVIGSDAFRSCSRLRIVNMAANGLQTIKDGAWRSCERLTEISLPDSVKELGNRVFCACSHLRTIKLPANLIKLGEAVFADCRSLQSLELPEGLKEVGSKAFFGCRNLESIFIPESLTHLEEKLFDVSQKLTIYAPQGSAAESYAIAHAIPFCAASADTWQIVKAEKMQASEAKNEESQTIVGGEVVEAESAEEVKDNSASLEKKAKYLKRIAARTKGKRR